MSKFINIIGTIGLLIIICSYAFLSFELGLKKDTEAIIYALSNHIGLILISIVLYFYSIKNNIALLSLVSVYSGLFLFISTVAFVIVGLVYNSCYFDFKLALIVSTPLTFLYEYISYIKRRCKGRN